VLKVGCPPPPGFPSSAGFFFLHTVPTCFCIGRPHHPFRYESLQETLPPSPIPNHPHSGPFTSLAPTHGFKGGQVPSVISLTFQTPPPPSPHSSFQFKPRPALQAGNSQHFSSIAPLFPLPAFFPLLLFSSPSGPPSSSERFFWF